MSIRKLMDGTRNGLIVFLLVAGGSANADLIGLGALNTGPDEVMSLFNIDTNTGESTLIGSTGIAGLQGLAVNPLTGDVFATGGYDDASAAGLYQIDPTTGTASYIGGTGNFVALDFSPDGVLYGVGALGNTDDGVADDLYTIDLETGLATRIVFLGAFSSAGITFSLDGSQIVYTWGGTQVSTIDPTSGTVTHISAVGGANVKRIATSPDETIYNANFPTSGAARLYTLDISAPAKGTLVGETGVYFAGLAFKGPLEKLFEDGFESP